MCFKNKQTERLASIKRKEVGYVLSISPEGFEKIHHETGGCENGPNRHKDLTVKPGRREKYRFTEKGDKRGRQDKKSQGYKNQCPSTEISRTEHGRNGGEINNQGNNRRSFPRVEETGLHGMNENRLILYRTLIAYRTPQKRISLKFSSSERASVRTRGGSRLASVYVSEGNESGTLNPIKPREEKANTPRVTHVPKAPAPRGACFEGCRFGDDCSQVFTAHRPRRAAQEGPGSGENSYLYLLFPCDPFHKPGQAVSVFPTASSSLKIRGEKHIKAS